MGYVITLHRYIRYLSCRILLVMHVFLRLIISFHNEQDVTVSVFTIVFAK